MKHRIYILHISTVGCIFHCYLLCLKVLVMNSGLKNIHLLQPCHTRSTEEFILWVWSEVVFCSESVPTVHIKLHSMVKGFDPGSLSIKHDVMVECCVATAHDVWSKHKQLINCYKGQGVYCSTLNHVKTGQP